MIGPAFDIVSVDFERLSLISSSSVKAFLYLTDVSSERYEGGKYHSNSF